MFKYERDGVRQVVRKRSAVASREINLIALRLVGLLPLMSHLANPATRVGLIDGPVDRDHPDLEGANIVGLGTDSVSCRDASSPACRHGTSIALMLFGHRDRSFGICRGCTLLVRPLFDQGNRGVASSPQAHPDELAVAIRQVVDAGAHVINLSVGIASTSFRAGSKLERALDWAASCGTVVVAAAGNQSFVCSTAITRHPWVLPVAACDLNGVATAESNLSLSTGRRGLLAPSKGLWATDASGRDVELGGTSFAAPFVSGTAGLLGSRLSSRGAEIRESLIGNKRYRTSIVPPL